jgi:hypothetical protein
MAVAACVTFMLMLGAINTHLSKSFDKPLDLVANVTAIDCQRISLSPSTINYSPTGFTADLADASLLECKLDVWSNKHLIAGGKPYVGTLLLNLTVSKGHIDVTGKKEAGSCLTASSPKPTASSTVELTATDPMALVPAAGGAALLADFKKTIGLLEGWKGPLLADIILGAVVVPLLTDHKPVPTAALPTIDSTTPTINNNTMVGFVTQLLSTMPPLLGLKFTAVEKAEANAVSMEVAFLNKVDIDTKALKLYLPPGQLSFDLLFNDFQCNATACVAAKGLSVMNLRLAGEGDVDHLVNAALGGLLQDLLDKLLGKEVKLPANTPTGYPMPTAKVGAIASCPRLVLSPPKKPAFALALPMAPITLLGVLTISNISCPSIDFPAMVIKTTSQESEVLLKDTATLQCGFDIEDKLGKKGERHNTRVSIVTVLSAGSVKVTSTLIPNTCLTHTATVKKVSLTAATDFVITPPSPKLEALLNNLTHAFDAFLTPLVQAALDQLVKPALENHAPIAAVALPAPQAGTTDIRTNGLIASMIHIVGGLPDLAGFAIKMDMVAANAIHASLHLVNPALDVSSPDVQLFLPVGFNVEFDVVLKDFVCGPKLCHIGGGIELLNLRMAGAGEMDHLVTSMAAGPLLNELLAKVFPGGKMPALPAATIAHAKNVDNAPYSGPPSPPVGANADHTGLWVGLGVGAAAVVTIAAVLGLRRHKQHQDEVADMMEGLNNDDPLNV